MTRRTPPGLASPPGAQQRSRGTLRSRVAPPAHLRHTYATTGQVDRPTAITTARPPDVQVTVVARRPATPVAGATAQVVALKVGGSSPLGHPKITVVRSCRLDENRPTTQLRTPSSGPARLRAAPRVSPLSPWNVPSSDGTSARLCCPLPALRPHASPLGIPRSGHMFWDSTHVVNAPEPSIGSGPGPDDGAMPERHTRAPGLGQFQVSVSTYRARTDPVRRSPRSLGLSRSSRRCSPGSDVDRRSQVP